jgi:aspartate aminotransferase
LQGQHLIYTEMTKYLSQRLQNMEQSSTMALNQRAKDLQQQGLDIINLTAGEPDFFTPTHIKNAAKAAVDANFSFYTPVEGYMDVRTAIAGKLKRENNIDYTPQQIIVTNGAKHAIANAILSIIDDGDEVIIPAPYWVSYSELVKLAGGISIILKTSIDNGFKMTAKQLEAAVTPRSKMLILCSPCNPSGAVYSRQELQDIASVVALHERLFVLSDEIYEHINFVGGHQSIAQFDVVKEKTCLVNGISKAYAMTGYRIGYAAAPLWWTQACAKLQGHVTSNASSIAQKAAQAALSEDNAPTQAMTAAFLRRRNLVMAHLQRIPRLRCLVPEGAFYVFPDVSAFYGQTLGGVAINNDVDMCMFLLERALVAAVPGSAFGEPSCIRLSFAASDEKLEQAMQRIATALTPTN